MKLEKSKIEGYLCLWEWNKTAWKFVAIVPVDEYGRCEKNDFISHDSRYPQDDWLRTSDPDDEDHDPEPIMGRAVTTWDIDHGIRLIGFEPPNYVKWLGVGAYDWIKESPNWFMLIAGGHELRFGTIQQVQSRISLS